MKSGPNAGSIPTTDKRTDHGGKMKIKTTFTIAAILLAAAQFACAATVTLTPLNVFLNKPVGLGYNSVSSSLIISINYDNGLPNQFAQLPASGVPSQFSNASGWSHGEEITHTIIPTALVGFQTGDVYAPNGEPGGIGRIRADGTEERFWTALVDGQNTESGSVSGLYLDTAGVFTDDYRLIAVTTAGGIWRVKSDGTAKLLKQTSFTTLEGVVTVPNNSRYGPWMNQVLVGAENASEILAVTAGGVVTPYSLTANGQTVTPEDILIVPANQNFFITDFGSNRLLTAPASQFTSLAGEIIVTQEGLAKLVHVTGFSGQSAQGELLYSGANTFERSHHRQPAAAEHCGNRRGDQPFDWRRRRSRRLHFETLDSGRAVDGEYPGHQKPNERR